MTIGVRILSNNLSGLTTNVTYHPLTGGTISLGEKVFPFEYITEYYYGTYACYVPTYDYTYNLTILAPTPTPTPTNTSTSVTPTPTLTPTRTPTPTPFSRPFVSVWDAFPNIELPYDPLGTYSGTIDWGDGNFSANTYSNRTHTYASPGTYTITITGTIEGWNFLNYATSYAINIREIISWGTLNGNPIYMFFNCSTLTLTRVTDTPNFIGFGNFFGMFGNCSSLTTVNNMNSWDVSGVGNMANMFRGATSFNQNIGNWDVSGVFNMFSMFRDATSFNQNIGNWDVSSVIGMEDMFLDATSFNQDLSNWCVSLIPSTPSNFSAGATSWTLPKPVWGTCPPPPTPTQTPAPTPTPTP